MRLIDFWRQLQCLILGHQWIAYFYPRCDGWLSGPHYRRECARCDRDEALRTDP